MKLGHAGAADNMGTAYDLEGFTSSTLRSKGWGTGVGVEEVCRALVTMVEGGLLPQCIIPSLQMWIIETWGLRRANARGRVRYTFLALEYC
jgi:hypothetical protein